MRKLSLVQIVCFAAFLCLAAQTDLSAQMLTTLHSFNFVDGADPTGLVQASDGNFYGTTASGGADGGGGTVFKITASGMLTTLYTFCSQSDCTDGYWPIAQLMQATDGDLYGTTYYGGAAVAGTLFKITATGMLTTLYSFCSKNNCVDGRNPSASLMQASDGNFYGTTQQGGPGNCGSGGCGTVFKITPSGALTTLHIFCFQLACTDGANPMARLVQAGDGNFYGTAYDGGPNYYGEVFKITPSGRLTVLHSFDDTDGAYPSAGLVQASDGNLYGTTSYGHHEGVRFGGTVFKITLGGTLTTLHSFSGSDGWGPDSVLVQASDGNFYGTTAGAGTYGGGTVFRITASGTLTTLYSFCSQSGCTDGAYPTAGFIQASDGNFYGTTSGGGAYGYGTVFRLVLPRVCTVCPATE